MNFIVPFQDDRSKSHSININNSRQILQQKLSGGSFLLRRNVLITSRDWFEKLNEFYRIVYREAIHHRLRINGKFFKVLSQNGRNHFNPLNNFGSYNKSLMLLNLL